MVGNWGLPRGPYPTDLAGSGGFQVAMETVQDCGLKVGDVFTHKQLMTSAWGADDEPMHGKSCSMSLVLPPLAAVWLRWEEPW